MSSVPYRVPVMSHRFPVVVLLATAGALGCAGEPAEQALAPAEDTAGIAGEALLGSPAWTAGPSMGRARAVFTATLLGTGMLRVEAEGGTQRFSVDGGFLQVAEDHVRVVTEKATPA